MRLPAEIIKKKYQITVCADGFVSVVDDMRNRRLKAGIPVWGTDDIAFALHLISRVCTLSCCTHGGKTGTTVEPKMPVWPKGGCSDIEGDTFLPLATEAFLKAEKDYFDGNV